MILDLAEARLRADRARKLDRLAELARQAAPDDPGGWLNRLLTTEHDAVSTDDTPKDRAARIPFDLYERATALVPRLAAATASGPLGGALRVTISSAIRAALDRGLTELEQELDDLEAGG